MCDRGINVVSFHDFYIEFLECSYSMVFLEYSYSMVFLECYYSMVFLECSYRMVFFLYIITNVHRLILSFICLFYRSQFVLFLLAIVLSVLRYTDSECPIGISKLFLDSIIGSRCGRVVQGAGRKAKRMVLQCINGVGSNPVEGRTNI